jgi:hypothetical protein
MFLNVSLHSSSELKFTSHRVSVQPSTMASSAYPCEGDRQPIQSGPDWLRQQALRLELAAGKKRHFQSQQELESVKWDSLNVPVDEEGATDDQQKSETARHVFVEICGRVQGTDVVIQLRQAHRPLGHHT